MRYGVAALMLLFGCTPDVTPTGATSGVGAGSSTSPAASSSSSGMGGAAGGGGASSSATTTATSSTAASSTSASTGSAMGCNPACDQGVTCCNGACVNIANDVNNCAGCGNACPGKFAYCDGTSCTLPPCNGMPCALCCGDACCSLGQLCCAVNGPGPTSGPKCYDPVNGTCPIGCPLCN